MNTRNSMNNYEYLNHHSKELIITLKEEGYKPSQILRILENEGVEGVG